MAAVFACGEGAALSHRSAAELWGIRRARPAVCTDGIDTGMIDVTVASTAGRSSRKGISVHRSSTLTADACTQRIGILVTTPKRTLDDLVPLLSPAQYASAVREAEFLRLPLAEGANSSDARTELESRFLALCRHHRLPTPAVNEAVDRYEVDFLWTDRRLIVEVDGWESHRMRSAFEEDRARDARLTLLGYRVVRFTWRHVTGDPAAVVRMIRSLLAAGT